MTTKAMITLLALTSGICLPLVPAKATEIANSATRTTHSLQVEAAAAAVDVSPRGGLRTPIVLPALEFVFSVNAACANSFEPESVTLTVADSRSYLGADQLLAPDMPELRLTVPANQIAPLIVTDFCVVAGAEETVLTDRRAVPNESLTVPATLSANTSLLCVSEGKQEILYTTTPLDVMLTCASDDPPGNDE